MKTTYVINYFSMNVGGIENYLAQIVENGLERGCRVIWLCDAEYDLSPVYAHLMDDPRVEKCRCSNHGFRWFAHEKLTFSPGERVVIFSCSFFDQMRALQLRWDFPEAQVIPLCLVPHFLGSDLYPEAAFSGIWKRFVRNFAKEAFAQWQKYGWLYCFSQKHFDVIEERYGLHIAPEDRKIVPLLRENSDFSREEAVNRYEAEDFTIISPGRLEFPHKGFALGLLREYAKLKSRYPRLKLKFIGEGDGEEVLRRELAGMAEAVSQDVEILPMMPFEQLCEEYKKAQLNISVAGCASAGAKLGVITLPARHYTYECEVYGFFPESRPFTTETKPGEPVAPYIERVLHMSREEYLALSRKAYDTMADKKPDRDHFLRLEAAEGPKVTKKTIREAYAILMGQRMLYKLHLLKE